MISGSQYQVDIGRFFVLLAAHKFQGVVGNVSLVGGGPTLEREAAGIKFGVESPEPERIAVAGLALKSGLEQTLHNTEAGFRPPLH